MATTKVVRTKARVKPRAKQPQGPIERPEASEKRAPMGGEAPRDVRICPVCFVHIEDGETHVEVGLCFTCKRWRLYGGKCPVCGNANIQLRQVITSELKAQFAELVMVVQDVLHDSEKAVRDAVNPLFWANCTKGGLRQAITVLSGLASVNGLQLPGSHIATLGEERIRSIDGEEWWCRETPQGIIPVRRVKRVAGGDFTCQYCQARFQVRIQHFNHEKVCSLRPVAVG